MYKDPFLFGALKDKQYNTIVRSSEYKKLLKEMSQRIILKSQIAPNEATIESYFDCELFAFFKEIFSPLGFLYEPIKEASIATKRHVTKGRADTSIGALVIEFKQPSTLSNDKQCNKAIMQISEYLDGISSNTELVGFVTDGVKGCFVNKNDNEIKIGKFVELTGETLDYLIQSIIKLKLTALNSKNLVDNFCNPPENNGIAFKLTNILYANLTSKMLPKTQMLYNEWKELFNLSHDDISKQQAIIDRKEALENLLNVRFSQNDEEYKGLYALQTAYAIIIKIIAYRILSITRYKEALIDFEKLIKINSESLREHLLSLEEGSIFRDYGVLNLLEGDFFSWYTTKGQWSEDLANGISEVFKILSLYSNKPVLNTKNKSADFFKELYEEMMPPAVRHSLGEYYTKKWLAKDVIEKAIKHSNNKKWKGLDPCCGSGTFLTIMIEKVLNDNKFNDKATQLKNVLSRVMGIDLNPIAVLTARVNYFINIAHLLEDEQEFEIPVYLGDSSYVPTKKVFDGINCLEYTINTLVEPINILIPASMVANPFLFSKTMTDIELYIKNLDINGAYNHLINIIPKAELTSKIKFEIEKLASVLVELERKNWDGIWARIITNYLTTANLGKFDIIVGNPPWVDWKNLPSGYREKIKSLCISRKLFSGDRITGGINLNICALIANVVAENWLSKTGTLALLMPEPLIFQQSYEGFRNLYLSNDEKLYFQEFTNWNKAGKPFDPVSQKFLTYFISHKKQDYKLGIPVKSYILKKGKKYENLEDIDFEEYFEAKDLLAVNCHSSKNIFSYVSDIQQSSMFSLIAGESEYIGHEGIEFYPQEMLIFRTSDLPSTKSCTSLKNIQVKKSKYHVPETVSLLETEYLHPLIKGVDISPFHVDISNNIVPFPYDNRDVKLPIKLEELSQKAPKLAKYYLKHKSLIMSQTQYNERIIGKSGEFYALARVGAYSFADYYVCYRDNTKWGAAVVSSIDTDWGGKKRPLFQNHAVSICEDNNGNFISLDEAHFICGILNTNVAKEYIIQSSDSRSFPIRPRLYIPKYDENNALHKRIVNLSKEAHNNYQDKAIVNKIVCELDSLYVQLAKNKDETKLKQWN